MPKSVRRALGVDYGGKITFRVENGRVTVRNPAAEHHDPVLLAFLKFLEKDIAAGNVKVVAQIACIQIEADLQPNIDLDEPSSATSISKR